MGRDWLAAWVGEGQLAERLGNRIACSECCKREYQLYLHDLSEIEQVSALELGTVATCRLDHTTNLTKGHDFKENMHRSDSC